MRSEDLFLLGAGFSRAVNSSMPTLAELGASLAQSVLSSKRHTAMLPDTVRRLLIRGQVPGGNVEVWLSSLAERQPFISEADASVNYGLFLEITRQIVQLVVQPQQGFWNTAPSSVHRLARLWHRAMATVVTLNYDTIVEESILQLQIPDVDDNIVNQILRFLPRAALPILTGSQQIPTAHLIKLHGSVDWYWNPVDSTGDTICKLPPGIGTPESKAALAGKVPFIVPPLATKGPFYSLGLVRELWQQAAQAFEIATRVFVIGYSVPLTDFTITTMLSQTAGANCAWHIVDPHAAEVAERLGTIGIATGSIHAHASLDSFVDSYEEDQYQDMTDQVARQLATRSALKHAPIMIKQARDEYLIVSSIYPEPDRVALDAHKLEPGWIIPADYPRESDLLEQCQQAHHKPIYVQIGTSPDRYAVLGVLDRHTTRGSHAVLDWCALDVQDSPSPS